MAKTAAPLTAMANVRGAWRSAARACGSPRRRVDAGAEMRSGHAPFLPSDRALRCAESGHPPRRYLSVVDRVDFGLLVLRLAFGLMLVSHGYNKFFGPNGLPGTARWFESMGVRPGRLNATVAATTEVGGPAVRRRPAHTARGGGGDRPDDGGDRRRSLAGSDGSSSARAKAWSTA